MQLPTIFCTCVLALIVALSSCTLDPRLGYEQPKEPYSLPSMDGDALNVIVEIPAGTNHKVEYHIENGFQDDTLAGGVRRVINFLPYPGNYGFIPSTMMDKARGGDGDALDILVISETIPTGSRITVKPIATLLLKDRGELDTKIIGVPVDSNLQVFQVDNYLDFALKHDAARNIIESWFLNYKGQGVTELIRWEDDAYAWREVRKWKTD